MRISRSLLAVTLVLTATIMLAGCSTSGSGATPLPLNFVKPGLNREAVPPFLERHAKAPLLYIADTTGNFIDVFHRDGTLVGRIVDGLNYPLDLYVDADHNLWVANNGDHDVLEFRRGAMRAAAVYHDVSDAWDAATCADRTLYATQFSGTVLAFAPRHHFPTGSLQENYGAAISVACDAQRNIFLTTTVLSPPGYVVEFPAGSNQAKLLPIYLPNPVDAKPDPTGNLLVLDSAGGPYDTVTEYTKAGSPTGRSMPTDANWNEIAIPPSGNAIFGADMTNAEGSLRAFPSGRQLRTYVDSKLSQLGGIAYDPG